MDNQQNHRQWRCKMCGKFSPIAAYTCLHPGCGADLTLHGEVVLEGVVPPKPVSVNINNEVSDTTPKKPRKKAKQKKKAHNKQHHVSDQTIPKKRPLRKLLRVLLIAAAAMFATIIAFGLSFDAEPIYPDFHTFSNGWSYLNHSEDNAHSHTEFYHVPTIELATQLLEEYRRVLDSYDLEFLEEYTYTRGSWSYKTFCYEYEGNDIANDFQVSLADGKYSENCHFAVALATSRSGKVMILLKTNEQLSKVQDDMYHTAPDNAQGRWAPGVLIPDFGSFAGNLAVETNTLESENCLGANYRVDSEEQAKKLIDEFHKLLISNYQLEYIGSSSSEDDWSREFENYRFTGTETVSSYKTGSSEDRVSDVSVAISICQKGENIFVQVSHAPEMQVSSCPFHFPT